MGILTRALEPQFTSGSRRRGLSYFREGRVVLGAASDRHAEARVRGTRLYRVRVELAGKEDSRSLAAECDCPFEEPCKHIWATLLAAEQRGHLQVVGTPERSASVAAFVPRGSPAVVRSDDEDFESYEEDDDLGDEDRVSLGPAKLRAVAAALGLDPSPRPAWRAFVDAMPARAREAAPPAAPTWRVHEVACVVEDAQPRFGGADLKLRCYERKSTKKGTLGPWRPVRYAWRQAPPELAKLRSILASLRVRQASYSPSSYSPEFSDEAPFTVGGEACDALLARLAAASALVRFEEGTRESVVLAWDPGPALCPSLRMVPGNEGYQLELVLRREAAAGSATPVEQIPASDIVRCARDLVVLRDRVARCDVGLHAWLAHAVAAGPIVVPSAEVEGFIAAYYSAPRRADLELPPGFVLERSTESPRCRVHLGAPRLREVPVDLSFEYAGTVISASDTRHEIVDVGRRRRITRDTEAETAAGAKLHELGARRDRWRDELTLPAAKAPGAVRALVSQGWHVEATGKLYRSATDFRVNLTSGIDWFDLDGAAVYDGMEVPLPSLLAALRRGESAVVLGDGTLGMLPEQWLARWRVVGDLGEVQGDRVRMRRSQVSLLDAVLEAEPGVQYDAAFRRLRDELRASSRPEPIREPRGFAGELRDYQRVGLGWIQRMASTGFGGCLADDMGLGKTVQVLAWLEHLRGSKKRRGPSLVVAPRSLLFNWKDEAARFAPKLTVLEHAGVERVTRADQMEGYDLVLTTYGTLRRDAVELSEIPFRYVILDEAQAIKNAASATFAAARSLRAEHRLALTGTPVENHMGELFAIFEFLNPSMLGRTATSARRPPELDAARAVGRALRPFILRRTKQEVASELPDKTEKTLYCELDLEERRLYDELAAHYRRSLLGRIAETGMKKATMHVLEALLRLRQAACHPGLVDKERTRQSSSKVDTLLAELDNVVGGGHKAIVFSQFTSLLAIVRARLDERGVRYEYLDGATRDRAAPVARFQADGGSQVFLVSLKAGGLGLNLTAAEYVFILDPWWNPAVEAQAIDRAHRIGQTRSVFAYRIIARGTVEEKVAELQQSKAALVRAILTEGETGESRGTIADLSLEDLRTLLG